jgi:hypothetical protein
MKIVFFDTSDREYMTSAGRPGSLDYETKDANTFSVWGCRLFET